MERVEITTVGSALLARILADCINGLYGKPWVETMDERPATIEDVTVERTWTDEEIAIYEADNPGSVAPYGSISWEFTVWVPSLFYDSLQDGDIDHCWDQAPGQIAMIAIELRDRMEAGYRPHYDPFDVQIAINTLHGMGYDMEMELGL
jgi:hypothetical protein